MAVLKASALRLASNAMKDGAVVVRGRLSHDEEGHFCVGDRDLSDLLEQREGNELIVILATVSDSQRQQFRQCGVCGRDYLGPECPHCAEVRARLRGRD